MNSRFEGRAKWPQRWICRILGHVPGIVTVLCWVKPDESWEPLKREFTGACVRCKKTPLCEWDQPTGLMDELAIYITKTGFEITGYGDRA